MIKLLFCKTTAYNCMALNGDSMKNLLTESCINKMKTWPPLEVATVPSSRLIDPYECPRNYSEESNENTIRCYNNLINLTVVHKD